MEKGTKENPRHIIGISGGKDSSALAIHIKKTRPDIFEKLELFFTDTGSELPEVYEFLDKLEKYLDKKILRLKVDLTNDTGYKVVDGHDDSVPFDDLLGKFKGFLPSPMARWCTRELKIKPMEKWVGKDHCVSYIGIRIDEPTREGYVQGGQSNIVPVYPFREDSININGVYNILDESVGLPYYYNWRTRSGCYFCFYQRRVEWAILYKLYPDWFEMAKQYETEHEDGRTFTWVKDKPLDYIKNNADDIIIRYVKKQHKKLVVTKTKYNMDQMVELIKGDIRILIDSGDIKILHDADGENKDGCTVCAI